MWTIPTCPTSANGRQHQHGHQHPGEGDTHAQDGDAPPPTRQKDCRAPTKAGSSALMTKPEQPQAAPVVRQPPRQAAAQRNLPPRQLQRLKRRRPKTLHRMKSQAERLKETNLQAERPEEEAEGPTSNHEPNVFGMLIKQQDPNAAMTGQTSILDESCEPYGSPT